MQGFTEGSHVTPDLYVSARVQSLTQVEISFNQISLIEGFALAPTAFAQLSRCQCAWGLQFCAGGRAIQSRIDPYHTQYAAPGLVAESQELG